MMPCSILPDGENFLGKMEDRDFGSGTKPGRKDIFMEYYFACELGVSLEAFQGMYGENWSVRYRNIRRITLYRESVTCKDRKLICLFWKNVVTALLSEWKMESISYVRLVANQCVK